MQDIGISRVVQETHEGRMLSIRETLRVKLPSIIIRRSELLQEIQRFSRWLELDAARKAEEWNQSTIEIILQCDGTIESLRIGPRKYENDFAGKRELWGFLWSIGIRNVILDARLDRNQIEDVMVLLYAFRRNLAHRKTSTVPQRVMENLLNFLQAVLQ